jgi:hypothetical protein
VLWITRWWRVVPTGCRMGSRRIRAAPSGRSIPGPYGHGPVQSHSSPRMVTSRMRAPSTPPMNSRPGDSTRQSSKRISSRTPAGVSA